MLPCSLTCQNVFRALHGHVKGYIGTRIIFFLRPLISICHGLNAYNISRSDEKEVQFADFHLARSEGKKFHLDVIC